MKTKTYGYGKYGCKTYIKPVGHGWETGVICNSKTVFVGNFVYQDEAKKWYATMNREIVNFARKYPVGERFPTQWFHHFISSHLYTTYYRYLDKVFVSHKKDFTRALSKDTKTYRKLKAHWTTHEKDYFYKHAA